MKTILLDTRESNDIFVSLIADKAKEKEFDVIMRALPVGDIQYGNIIIERKEINDFVSSICGDRMWDQIYQMKLNPMISSMIFLSGGYEKLWKDNKDKIPTIEGAFFRILSTGIPLKRFDTDENLVDFALQLFEYAAPLNVPIKRVEKNKKDSLFMALPGVGRKNSKILRSEYRNICELCEASEKELQVLLGPVKGKSVYNALR